MDHLPYPNLGVPPIVVPYLSDFEYDGEDFATFPKRIGFWKDGELDLDRPCQQLAALAQAWLFFGLIDVFTGQHVDKGMLIRREYINGADEGVVDTTMLGGILKESFRRPWMPFARFKALKDIRVQLLEAARASSTLDRIEGNDSPSSTVFLSIKILIIYLSEMLSFATWARLRPSLPSFHRLNSFNSPILETRRPNGTFPAPASLLMDRMKKSGWCIHQILDIFRFHHYYTVYYYSSIPRAESWDDITHEACTEAQCVAYNIKDNSAYRIRHIKEGCGCELVGPSEDEVANIVRKGDIPLVELNSASLENQTQLEVKPTTAYSRYTAISHVWIDGHGNPTANTLPRCQLQRLAARLSAISNAQQSWVVRLWKRLRDPPPTSHLLWMDTLCIPPQQDSEDRKFLRKKAIQRMALIYVGAEQVLVLDAELDKFTHEGSPRELTDALISCARWNGRCWTLEEGALARKCLFQFKDVAKEATWHHRSSLLESIWAACFVSIDELRRWRSAYQWPPQKISSDFAHDYLHFELANAARRSAQADIGHALYATALTRPGHYLQVNKFVRTWNDIGRRSTTRPEDIHPIMANLTDFSATQIMGLETPVMRTKMIAHCIGRFPLDMLWTPCARPQANEDSADRWIPSIPGPGTLVEYVNLRSTRKGLVVNTENCWKPPEMFWIPLGMVDPRFYFRWSQLWYVVECIIAEDDALPRNASETAFLVLSSDTASTTAASQVLRGARLLVTKGNQQISSPLHVRYDCPLICTIQRHPPDVEQIPDIPIMQTVNKVSRNLELIIESTFDPKDREKFNMRSRDFYYGPIQNVVDQSIMVCAFIFSLLPLVLVMNSDKSFVSSFESFYGLILFNLALVVVSCGVCFAIALLLVRWMRVRAYNAWKKTFEEDWRPKDSFFRRLIEASPLLRWRKRGFFEEKR